jgi:hypothetical protein
MSQERLKLVGDRIEADIGPRAVLAKLELLEGECRNEMADRRRMAVSHLSVDAIGA